MGLLLGHSGLAVPHPTPPPTTAPELNKLTQVALRALRPFVDAVMACFDPGIVLVNIVGFDLVGCGVACASCRPGLESSTFLFLAVLSTLELVVSSYRFRDPLLPVPRRVEHGSPRGLCRLRLRCHCP